MNKKIMNKYSLSILAGTSIYLLSFLGFHVFIFPLIPEAELMSFLMPLHYGEELLLLTSWLPFLFLGIITSYIIQGTLSACISSIIGTYLFLIFYENINISEISGHIILVITLTILSYLPFITLKLSIGLKSLTSSSSGTDNP